MKQCSPWCYTPLLSSSSSGCPVTTQLAREHTAAFEEVSRLFNKDDTSTVTKRYLELGSVGENATEAK